jgi:hypothetical protein
MIYAVYEKNGFRPVFTSKSKAKLDEYRPANASEDVRIFHELTERQVLALTITQATFMEMLISEGSKID